MFAPPSDVYFIRPAGRRKRPRVPKGRMRPGDGASFRHLPDGDIRPHPAAACLLSFSAEVSRARPSRGDPSRQSSFQNSSCNDTAGKDDARGHPGGRDRRGRPTRSPAIRENSEPPSHLSTGRRSGRSSNSQYTARKLETDIRFLGNTNGDPGFRVRIRGAIRRAAWRAIVCNRSCRSVPSPPPWTRSPRGGMPDGWPPAEPQTTADNNMANSRGKSIGGSPVPPTMQSGRKTESLQSSPATPRHVNVPQRRPRRSPPKDAPPGTGSDPARSHARSCVPYRLHPWESGGFRRPGPCPSP